MPITSTKSFSLQTIQHLVIDCAAVRRQPEIQRELSTLLHWMKENKTQSSVHVTLHSATANATGRKLKSVFQALGCVVTMKIAY